MVAGPYSAFAQKKDAKKYASSLIKCLKKFDSFYHTSALEGLFCKQRVTMLQVCKLQINSTLMNTEK